MTKNRSVIISVAIIGFAEHTISKAELSDLLSPLTSAYEFYELLFIDRIENREDYKDIIERIPNSRFLWVDNTLDHYLMRAVAANEAIGDSIIITTIPDLSRTDVLASLGKHARDKTTFYRYNRGVSSIIFRSISSLSMYDVDPSYSDTVVIGQSVLHKLKRLTESRLAYRFPNQSNLEDVEIATVSNRKSGSNNLKRKFTLLMDITFSSLKSIFLWLSALSALSAVIGISYLFYAIAVYFVVDNIQPGWFSTSVILSFFIFVLSSFIFCVSVFFVYASDALTKFTPFEYDLVSIDENLRLFSKVENETNVVD